jgi:heat shock protein HslJ
MNDITALMHAESANPPASGVDLAQVMSRGRRRRRRRAVATAAGASLTATAVVATLLVAANVFRGGPSSPPPGSAPGATSDTDPVALLRLWTVSGIGERDAKLRLGAREFHAVLPCGGFFGAWKANAAGQFLADLAATEGGCDTVYGSESGHLPRWLGGATSFRFEGDEAVLLDANGAVLARLSPHPESDVAPLGPDDPAAIAEFRAASVNPAPLPDGLTPATSPSLVGRWLPLDPKPGQPQPAALEIKADGTWEGSDGCNGMGGRWVGGRDALVIATIGPSTLIGCDNDMTPSMFAAASRAGFDGDELVLVDATGAELARLRPAPR